jgi:hypothetical protein
MAERFRSVCVWNAASMTFDQFSHLHRCLIIARIFLFFLFVVLCIILSLEFMLVRTVGTVDRHKRQGI